LTTSALPKSAAEFQEIVRLVNLRHHVAGVVRTTAGDHVRVVDGYEAEYAYVATAFIESIRRGLALCGLPAKSPRGRALGGQVATILYISSPGSRASPACAATSPPTSGFATPSTGGFASIRLRPASAAWPRRSLGGSCR
jgi:hypothetical protein